MKHQEALRKSGYTRIQATTAATTAAETQTTKKCYIVESTRTTDNKPSKCPEPNSNLGLPE